VLKICGLNTTSISKGHLFMNGTMEVILRLQVSFFVRQWWNTYLNVPRTFHSAIYRLDNGGASM
jgi:hypothetical protein